MIRNVINYAGTTLGVTAAVAVAVAYLLVCLASAALPVVLVWYLLTRM